MQRLPRLLLSLLLVATSDRCDQATKTVAAGTLRGAPPRSYAWDIIRLFYYENSGGFLSLGAGLIAFALFSRAPAPSTVIGVARLLGGAASNWADHVRNGNAVVDFLNVGVGPLRTGVFNVADLLLEMGLLILLVGSWWSASHAHSRAHAPQTTATPTAGTASS